MVSIGDLIDSKLNKSCQIYKKSGAVSRYNTETNDLVLVDTVPCRVSELTGKETIVDKEVSVNTKKIFMRPYPTLTEKHTLMVDGRTFNIQNIPNPSFLDHHYEVLVEEVKP